MGKAILKVIEKNFSPTLCVTHNCNLNCLYCYQNHDSNSRMSFETAKKSIDWILDNIPEKEEAMTLNFIGGEPLLEYELLKQIYSYVEKKRGNVKVVYFATTNGTVLTTEMKRWFVEHKDRFVLGLSLDGRPETHNYNRSNSFKDIDVQFFLENWPEQGVKMTLSEFSLNNLAENIIFLHELGFKHIDGVNLYEGDFDWGKEEYIKILVPQLKKLVDYYVNNPILTLNQMFSKKLELCTFEMHEKKKSCGIGQKTIFFDTDGKKYPCSFLTPMTFGEEELESAKNIDYEEVDNFIDKDCIDTCYLYPVCPNCSAANYLKTKTFNTRDKNKCKINKLIALFIADLHSKRILKSPELYEHRKETYYLIEAIKNIKNLYLDEFKEYL